jgi:TetR/AcrR family transcriptional regulator, repressor for uid operon
MPRLADATRIERRQQLIDAAWRCVGDRAFQSLSVDDVCAEAGVSKGAFYVYFEQKQDLLLALIDDEAARIDDVMQQLQRSQVGGVERLRRFARAMVKLGEDPAGLQIRADMWAEMSSSPEVREHWAGVVRARRAALRAWIEESEAAGELGPVPANALAAILLALGDGLLLHAGLDPSGFRWVNVGKALDAMFDGIAG